MDANPGLAKLPLKCNDGLAELWWGLLKFRFLISL